MSVRRIAALACAALSVLPLAACSDDDDPVVNSPEGLVIGVSSDLPGLSFQHQDGTFTGFDVDLGAYVAEGLGWNDRQITFQAVRADEREELLISGEVDMVVSAYSITDERDKSVDFAGPYMIAGQDLLVATDSTITGPRGLDGLDVCGPAGSPDLARLEGVEYSPEVELQSQPDTAACVDLLLDGTVDAVTNDNVILAGFAEEHAGELKVVGSPFTTKYYGIGLPENSPDVAVVNDLLGRAIDDGTWERSFEKYFGDSGFTAPLPPTPGSLG